MRTEGTYYLTSAPASATGGSVVLSPAPGIDKGAELVINQVTLVIPATEALTCAKWFGNHVASCSRFRVIVEVVG
jgi:hypothetical protein